MKKLALLLFTLSTFSVLAIELPEGLNAVGLERTELDATNKRLTRKFKTICNSKTSKSKKLARLRTLKAAAAHHGNQKLVSAIGKYRNNLKNPYVRNPRSAVRNLNALLEATEEHYSELLVATDSLLSLHKQAYFALAANGEAHQVDRLEALIPLVREVDSVLAATMQVKINRIRAAQGANTARSSTTASTHNQAQRTLFND